jgi:predicted alpha/beta hydrolase family esterase
VVVRQCRGGALCARPSVRGLVLIAPYCTDLGLEAVRRSGLVGQPWPWARIKADADRIAIFHSDRDPYVAQAEFAELAQRLDARVFEITGAGHFSEQDTFPELTDYLIQTYG